MKKIFLNAYDKVNFGDDLFVRYIANRYSNVKFFIWTDKNNKKTFSDVKNIKIIDKNSKFVSFLRRLRPSFESRYKKMLEDKCNAIVYIGGSIFIEYENWINQINWLNYQARNKFFVLGANFGPYKSEEYKVSLNKVFENMEDVCFRDKYSYNIFLKNKKVRYAPDILFNQFIPNLNTVKKQIFVSVINCIGRDGLGRLEQYSQSYIKNIITLLKNKLNNGYSIVLSSFCKEEGDETSVSLIYECLKEYEDSIIVCNYDGTNTNKILEYIAMSEYVIATRFHAMILGFAARKPVLPIIYSDKTKNVLIDLNFDGQIIDLRNDGNWVKCEDINLWKSLSINKIKELKSNSELHFSRLDDLFR